MELKARYYDGTVREGYEAIVQPLTENIKIQPTGESYMEAVYWPLNHITRAGHHNISKVLLQYTLLPKHYLEFNIWDFNKEIASFYSGRDFTAPYTPKRRSVWKPLLVIGSIVVGFFALMYFLVVPLVADGFARTIPKSTEVEMGTAMYNNIIAGYTVNEEATETINRFFANIGHPNDYEIKITVVKESQVNAFAMPGGNIVVFDGLLKETETYPELAALLSHEFSHIQHRHTTRSVVRSLGSYLFLVIILGSAGDVVTQIAQSADEVKGLSYSRSLEKEADMEGFNIMVQNRIDPKGMLGLFEKLEKQTTGQEPPEFLSTHPITNSRKEYVQEKLDEGGYTVQENPQLKSLFEKLKEQVN